jgi:phosphatidylglycerophosphate synthase
MLSRKYKATFGVLLQPVNLVLIRLRVSADHLTLAGLVFGILAGLAFAQGRLLLAGLFLALSGLSDMLDGSLARAAGETTRFGSFIDSVTDRYSECFIFGGLAWHYAGSPVLMLVLAALTGSLLVSYTRARAESLIERCEIGIAERPERMILLILGCLPGLMVPALWVIAVLAHVTALQRIHHTWREASARK